MVTDDVLEELLGYLRTCRICSERDELDHLGEPIYYN